MLIVQRAKQILDYVLTFHFFHLMCVWHISNHFPKGMSWWILQLVNIAIMTFGGEWACMHREMKPIMITSGNKNKTKNNTSGSSSSNTGGEDEQNLLGNKQKRKSSDAKAEGEINDQGALLAAVSKAKKALMAGGKSKRTTKKYDVIPMKDLDNDDNDSIHSSNKI
jgi:hypothetical protein